MGAGEQDPGLVRVSDAERAEVAERLRVAQDEGRLTLIEYDERLKRAYAATVRNELEQVVEDLPVRPKAAAVAPADGAEPAETGKRSHLDEWRSWAGTAVVLSTIWLVTGLAGDDGFSFFWPVIPLGIWAAVIVANLFWRDRD
ncbi:DUF1707 SHOCT-like domain-containing protein [Pseudonocardia phyllosphaerae]|uniref:DUF1707 SHOCT-like domain-containing protein n=1 Tax=Pseudonocardia phyllosphaerae TaxID=3390502 RepID=UPI00397890ED